VQGGGCRRAVCDKCSRAERINAGVSLANWQTRQAAPGAAAAGKGKARQRPSGRRAVRGAAMPLAASVAQPGTRAPRTPWRCSRVRHAPLQPQLAPWDTASAAPSAGAPPWLAAAAAPCPSTHGALSLAPSVGCARPAGQPFTTQTVTARRLRLRVAWQAVARARAARPLGAGYRRCPCACGGGGPPGTRLPPCPTRCIPTGMPLGRPPPPPPPPPPRSCPPPPPYMPCCCCGAP
jgi:hypothetical protein